MLETSLDWMRQCSWIQRYHGELTACLPSGTEEACAPYCSAGGNCCGLELRACLGLLWGLNSTSLGVGGRTFQDLELPGSGDGPARLRLWRQKKAHADACK